MEGEVTYFIAEVLSIFLLLLFGSSILISLPRNINAWLIALYCLGGIGYRLYSMANKVHPLLTFDWALHWLPTQILINMGPGLLVLLCFSLFHEVGRGVKLKERTERGEIGQIFSRFPFWFLGLFALQMGLSIARPLFVSNVLSEIDIPSIGEFTYFTFGQLPQLMHASFAIIALVLTVQGWRADLVESRRALRTIALVWFSLGALSSSIGYAYIIDASAYQIASMHMFITYSSVFVFTVIALLSFRFSTSAFESLTAPSQPQNTDHTAEEEFELGRFHKIFQDQHSYLEPGLTIADLAKKMAMPQYKLRTLINKKLGYRNFNALLNEHRIKDACTQLSNPEKDNLPILTIALSMGYQSIAPFNVAFRDIVGLTPSAYRKQSHREQIAVSQ